MDWNIAFFITNILLGVGLAMDAFSVSVANGLNEPQMKLSKLLRISGVFAFFQALMPMTGWFCVHMILSYFQKFERFIPWIAFILLGYIGGKMLFDAIRKKGEAEGAAIGFWGLLVQGIATSIDALSVGFTIADDSVWMALAASLLIAAVTFVICAAGVLIGKKAGMRYSGKASVLGGVILILIGMEIFVSRVF